MPTVEETLVLASQHHQTGNLRLAALLYQQIIEAVPQYAEVHSSLGVALAQQGLWDQAAVSLRQALQWRPDFPEAHNDLANVLQASGKLEEAVSHYGQAIGLRPGYPQAHNNLGVVLAKLGKLDESIAHHREAIRLDERYAAAHYNLGIVLERQNKLDEAICCYRQALSVDPAFAAGWNNLAIALARQDRLEEAIASFRRALDCRPHYAEAHSNLGAALGKQGDLAAAIAHQQEALRIKPDYATAHVRLGNGLRQSGKLDEAVSHLRTALQIAPDSVEGHTNLGIALMDAGQLDEAVLCHRQALRIDPQCANASMNLGAVLGRQGKFDEAVECYRQALRLQPDLAPALGNLVAWLNFNPEIDHDHVFAEHCRWGRMVQQNSPPRPHANDPSPDRRLRIGYVSPDFRFHALTRYLEPVLANHDERQVAVHCYAEAPVADAVTERLQRFATGWRWTCGLTNVQVAEQIRADGIDILVDLAGHTRYNRLGVFTHKPAPVQVTWLGYLNTTGLTTIDYRLTDDILDPPGQPLLDTEELMRLPGGMCCFAPPEDAPEVGRLPALGRRYLTFGSLNRLAKLNDKVYDLWSRVLQRLPTARLLMFQLDLNDAAQQRVRREFVQRGIAGHRLDLRSAADLRGYLAVYNDIDVVLDTFPCTGGVTTCEALWMGVPVLSLCGKRPMERNSATFLARVGLADWAVSLPERFIAKAVGLSEELPLLATLRGELRDRMWATVCNAERFTRVLEAAYRDMWRRWVHGRSVRQS